MVTIIVAVDAAGTREGEKLRDRSSMENSFIVA